MKKFQLVFIALFSVLVLAGCTTVPNNSNNNNTNTTATPTGTPDFTIELSDFEFTPDTLEVEAGNKYLLKLVGHAGTHSFVVDELGVQSTFVNANGETVVELDIPENAKGKTLEFRCGIAGHDDLGMVGTLVIK